jgi:hypothetical protein
VGEEREVEENGGEEREGKETDGCPLTKPHLSWVPHRNPLQLNIIGKRRP